MVSFRIATRGSFKRQVILSFVVGFLFLIVAFVAYMVKAESSYRYRDSSDVTVGLAQALAVSSLSWVLANDVVGLQEVVYSFRSYPELRYAMVISPRGRVLAHSDATKVGQYVTDEQSLALIKAPPGKQVVADNESIVDIAVPIEIDKRHVGWARVGLGREGIAANLRKMILSDTLFVLLATALSLLAAILIANRLGYRIGLLVRVAEEVQAGNFAMRVTSIPGGNDEITKLADSLNQMLDALARNEERLRSASLYTRSLIEVSLDPLVTISPEGKITDVNQATEEVTGRSRSELIGTDFSDYFTEPDKAREGYRQVFLEGLVTDYPLAIRHQDGHITEVLYNASIYHDESGKVLGVFAAARDVTKRKQAEEELRKLNNDFVTLLENTSDFIYFKDQDSRIRFCSQTLADITGHKSWHDMIGKHDLEIFPADTARIYYEEELPIFREGKALLNKNDPYYDKQGKQGWVNTNKWPVFGDDKKTVVGIFGISRDITELKEAENRINELNRDLEQRVAARTAELEAANQELEAFSYSVSHDLRTPLRAIDGFSLMLLEDYQNKLDDEGKRLLNVVRNNTSRMSRLIDDILRFSRAGRTEISFTEIDMEAMACGVIEELKLQVSGRKLQINLGSLPSARGDRAMLHQVFENLLANAIKFTGKNEEARIDIGGRIEAGKAVYHVKDNGAGFDMQYAGKLFGVFQRLHGVDEFEGTGIGLAIVKQIVARHGGTVWAEGEVGKGATFYFSIPVNPEKSA